MPGWAWALVAVAAVLVLATATWRAFELRRRRKLQGRVAPEHDRAVGEAEPSERTERREGLEIRPLRPATRERYVRSWGRVQAQFVDDPDGAVRGADMLVQQVMSHRGYPMDDFEQRAADVSVDHPLVVENYREGHRLTRAAALGDGTTEELRQAMQHYRVLFEELLADDADAPISRDPSSLERDRRGVPR